MDHFLDKINKNRDDVCWEGNWYKYRYPRSFEMRPQAGTTVPTTLNKISPHEMTFVPCPVVSNYWTTTTGKAHGKKILGRHFQYPQLNKAPGALKMSYIFPHEESRMQYTPGRLIYNPRPFYQSIMKTDYVPRRPIHDFDYQNVFVNIPPPRSIRISKRGKPGFYDDEIFSILRKFNPYMSSYKIDFVNASREKFRFESSCC